MKEYDEERQQHYDEKVQEYQEKIRTIQKAGSIKLEECRKAPEAAAVKLFGLANDMLNLASNYLVINGVGRAILGARDEDALGEARKAITMAIIYIENIVTGKVDVPFSEYEENLAEISEITPDCKFQMVRKIGLAIALLKQGYGNNTKWRWSFIDIEGRFTVIAKNLLDLKMAFVNNNPSMPDYEPLLYHLHLVKNLLAQTAERFHDRYSLANKRTDDMRYALNFLSALYQIHLLLHERQEADTVKKKYDAWSAVFNAEVKKT
jgi:hypothetical protein